MKIKFIFVHFMFAQVLFQIIKINPKASMERFQNEQDDIQMYTWNRK